MTRLQRKSLRTMTALAIAWTICTSILTAVFLAPAYAEEQNHGVIVERHTVCAVFAQAAGYNSAFKEHMAVLNKYRGDWNVAIAYSQGLGTGLLKGSYYGNPRNSAPRANVTAQEQFEAYAGQVYNQTCQKRI